jgi:small conductance mechanosensitive channel
MNGLLLAPDAKPPSEDLSAAAASAHGLVHDLIVRLPVLGLGAAVFVLSLLVAHVARWAIKRATRNNRRANVGIVVGRLTYFATIILGGLVAVTIVAPSMTPARLVSLLGIGGVAIGFAFKDIFQNMLAGVLILWQEPFRIGDEITSGGFTGAVEAIETRATLVKTYDGKRIIIPNSQIYTEPVSVISAYDMLRSEYDVGIGYGDDVGKAKEIFMDILRKTDGILEKPEPDLIVWELAASTVNVRLRWWTKPDRPSVVHVRGRVLEQVRERLPAAGIDLPYPTQVMLFHDQTDEADGDRTRQREGWPAGDSPPGPAKIAAAIRSSAGRHADVDGRDDAARASVNGSRGSGTETRAGRPG